MNLTQFSTGSLTAMIIRGTLLVLLLTFSATLAEEQSLRKKKPEFDEDEYYEDTGEPIPELPSTFCENKTDGFYADIPSKCKSFHYCQTFLFPYGENRTVDWRFECPESLVFNQEHLTCTPNDGTFNCEDSGEWYDRNSTKPNNDTEDSTNPSNGTEDSTNPSNDTDDSTNPSNGTEDSTKPTFHPLVIPSLETAFARPDTVEFKNPTLTELETKTVVPMLPTYSHFLLPPLTFTAFPLLLDQISPFFSHLPRKHFEEILKTMEKLPPLKLEPMLIPKEENVKEKKLPEIPLADKKESEIVGYFPHFPPYFVKDDIKPNIDITEKEKETTKDDFTFSTTPQEPFRINLPMERAQTQSAIEDTKKPLENVKVQGGFVTFPHFAHPWVQYFNDPLPLIYLKGGHETPVGATFLPGWSGTATEFKPILKDSVEKASDSPR